ncbi:ureidoglycolate lyase [Thalassobius sp. Cn5-15]|uniref:ureidoglycolate lyase n=1 Tax=Thalassobius sp. Cn5-15 TaxID=2917763 RepID=UPI001EF3A1AF|nr:ureidoglycolate lyase [Thalassobius sp. Cn5-15]MCG7495066.1 ureidoglycolate lyase [Thalassobius sp. Cn5-15]
MSILRLQPLTAVAFAPFGDVIEVAGDADKIINQGMCGRHHDLATLDFGPGRAGVSLFDAKARALPYTLDLMERHPLGSQAFIPLDNVPMIVTVAADSDGQPGVPLAFISQPGQSINIHRNVWHGVLAPLGASGRFVVIDHISDLPNLEEHWFDAVYTVDNP